MQVLPASLNLEATSISGPSLKAAVAGRPIYLTVAPKDHFGNVWAKGPLDLQASASLVPAERIFPDENGSLPVSIENNNDGSLLLSVSSQKVDFPF